MICERNGIEVLGTTRIVLDGPRESGINVISHAHSDHVGRIRKAIATRETAFLAGLEQYKDRLVLDDLEVRLVNAGHILGSSQVEILDGRHIAYTGDMRLRDSLLFRGAEILEPEVLILESTFGLPVFKFPSYEDILESAERWINENLKAGRHVILGGYSLGKAQELTKLSNEVGEIPIVTDDVWKKNRAYEALGIKIGDYLLAGTQEAEEAAREPSVFIAPVKLAGRLGKEALMMSYRRKAVSGIFTGWSLVFSFRSKGFDRAFPFSDHAGFDELVRYARESGAREIITVHGYKNELANALRRLGINARPIERIGGRGHDN